MERLFISLPPIFLKKTTFCCNWSHVLLYQPCVGSLEQTEFHFILSNVHTPWYIHYDKMQYSFCATIAQNLRLCICGCDLKKKHMLSLYVFFQYLPDYKWQIANRVFKAPSVLDFCLIPRFQPGSGQVHHSVMTSVVTVLLNLRMF